MQTRNYFADLNIEPTSDYNAIKRAYYKLMREVHPDKAGDNPAAHEKTALATNAWEYLQDENNRLALIEHLALHNNNTESASAAPTQSTPQPRKSPAAKTDGTNITVYVPCWVFESGKNPKYPKHELGIFADEAAELQTNPTFVYQLLAKRMNDLLNNREDSFIFAGADIPDALKIINLHSWYKPGRDNATQFILKMVIPLSVISPEKATEASLNSPNLVNVNNYDEFFLITKSNTAELKARANDSWSYASTSTAVAAPAAPTITADHIVSAHLTGQWSGFDRAENASRRNERPRDKSSNSLVVATSSQHHEEEILRNHAESETSRYAARNKGLESIPSVLHNKKEVLTLENDGKYIAMIETAKSKCHEYLNLLKKNNKPTEHIENLIKILEDNDPVPLKIKFERFIKAFTELRRHHTNDKQANTFFDGALAEIESAKKDAQTNPRKYAMLAIEDGKKDFEKFDTLFNNLLNTLPEKWREYVNADANQKAKLYEELIPQSVKNKDKETVNSILVVLCNNMSSIKDQFLNQTLKVNDAAARLLDSATVCKDSLTRLPKSTFGSLFGSEADTQAKKIGDVIYAQQQSRLEYR